MNHVPDIPKDLLNSIKNEKCALFVGAGLSMNAGYPSWNDLIKKLTELGQKQNIFSKDKAAELMKLNNESNKQLLVAQELYDEFGRSSFESELARIFHEKHDPSDVHLELPRIPFNLVVTTNYDQLIENAYAKIDGSIPKIYTHQDAADFSDALWRGSFFILKAHGDVNRKSSIVLTQKDYRTIIHSAPGYRAVLSAIFTTKSILFIGASLTDPETELLLSFLHDAFHGSGQYHYALVPESQFSEIEANRWRKDYKVTCLRYKPSKNHPEVLEFIKKISSSI